MTTSNDGSASTDPAEPATITVECADLTIVKSTDTPVVNEGDPIRYLIRVTNSGAGPARDVVVVDPLPEGRNAELDGHSQPGHLRVRSTAAMRAG